MYQKKRGDIMARNPLSEFERKLRKEISLNLKKHTKGITQADLSAMTGIPTSTLSGYFAERSTINAGNTQKIADALGIEKQDIDPRFKESIHLINSIEDEESEPSSHVSGERELFLKRLIEAKSGNIRAFSIDIGIPYSTIRSILTRGVMNSTVDNIFKICKGLGISPEELSPEFKTNEIIADTLTTMLRLDESRQQSVYNCAKDQLAEQNKTKVTEFSKSAKEEPKEDYNDPTMVIAAHMDDDFTEEEMEEVLRFIEFAKSKRKK